MKIKNVGATLQLVQGFQQAVANFKSVYLDSRFRLPARFLFAVAQSDAQTGGNDAKCKLKCGQITIYVSALIHAIKFVAFGAIPPFCYQTRQKEER